MKHDSYTAFRLLTAALPAIITLAFLLPQKAQASGNDYLEKESHYMAYATGVDKVHFKIPMWSKGGFWEHHYMLKPTSKVTYTSKETGEVTIANIVSYSWKGWDESDNKGDIAVKFYSGRGNIVITSCSSGVDYTVQPTGKWTPWLSVIRKEEAGCDAVSWLEFDWFPPMSLDGKTFSVKIYADIINANWTAGVSQANIDNPDYTLDWGNNYTMRRSFNPPFQGQSNLVAPQLYTPYLYQLNANGLTGFGYAAVPFSLFSEPLWYRTSLMGQKDSVQLSESDRSGNLYVMTNDTLQENFFADFKVYRTKNPASYVTLQSTNVDIPPYHRIYDFTATEETDSTGTFTGNNILTWRIKNPRLKDLIDGDYFVIERATDSAFTDAVQLGMVPMRRDSSGVYSLPDDSRATWTGNLDSPDTLNVPLSRKVYLHVVYDDKGQMAYAVELDLHTDRMVTPSTPVYYRITRASSSVWGWNSEFARKTVMNKNNYLAPLADDQPSYAKDVRYEENRQVNFRIRLDNAEVKPRLVDKDLFELSYIKRVNMRENVTVHSDFANRYTQFPNAALITVTAPDGDVLIDGQTLSEPKDFVVPRGSRVYVKYLTFWHPILGTSWSTSSFEAGDDCQLHFTVKTGPVMIESITQQPYEPATGGIADILTEERLEHLKDSLYRVFKSEYEKEVYGRCMWDKTARLVLVRTIEETGKSSEIIIPQDSIHRQADGSWIATFSDVADKACSHYRYSVRIDQSRSDLHVLYPATQLQPKALNGPDLYFDEGAAIASFTASQGDARTEMKPGVMLSWQPTGQSVDSYVLTRIQRGSDASPDTLYTGPETTHFDRDAEPDIRYEYTVKAVFNCNGKTTGNSATTEGWRTPYGEISGTVVLTDNSGMADVTVVLQDKDGNIVRTMTTDATGAYRFDSIEYDITGSTKYAVVPTHKYGNFSFNSTGAATASIGLSADNAVASGISFMNMSSVRLSGRVLYKNSTVPVAGAMFLLNGDTIRCNGAPLTSGIDGNFEIIVPERQPNSLQVFKPGHQFEGDGILRVEGGSETFALTKPLDGVRFYDMTTVRLVGRVAGGNDQKTLPEAFGAGRNNLGEDLQLVLQLEGDNTAHFVHDPDDLTRDTVMKHIAHIVYSIDETSTEPQRVAGTTGMVMEKKRIIIHPDAATGEFEVDLFPTKYKVVQATAKGYATLFAAGAGNEVFDLTNAPLTLIRDTLEKEHVMYNAVYDRIWRNPVKVELVQNIYGMERDGFGEPEMELSTFDAGQERKIALYTADKNGSVTYTLGYPVFYANRKYQFKAKAYEEYRFNNSPNGNRDIVPQRGGSVIVRNGLLNSKNSGIYTLDNNGENKTIWLDVDNADVENADTKALRTVSVALETEGNVVEANVFSAFVAGTVIEEKSVRSTDAAIQLLDIVRDPGGAGSSAYVESGTTYTFGYSENKKSEIGVKLTPTWGSNISNDVGIVTAPEGTGSYIGGTYTTSQAFHFNIPLTHTSAGGETYKYTLTTNERIQTSSSQSPSGVGSNADVFMGTTIAQLAGKAKSVCIINDTVYRLRKPAIDAGTMLVLANGTGADGKPYYLVTGEKVLLESRLSSTFVYTQKHILQTVIPQLALDRQNLLMNFKDSAEAKAMANATQKPVYWYHSDGIYLNDTLPRMTYDMIIPDGNGAWTNEVDAINHMLLQWLSVIVYNEREKVVARTQGKRVGVFSTSNGTSYTHSDTYSASGGYSVLPVGQQVFYEIVKTEKSTLTNFIGSTIKSLVGGFFKNENAVVKALDSYYKDARVWEEAEGEDGFNEIQNVQKTQKTPEEIGTVTNTSKFSMKFEPVTSSSRDVRLSTDATTSKKTGFTLAADPMGEITVSVYRAEVDSAWRATTSEILDWVDQGGNDDLGYGSYVFYTEGGSTLCPHEDAERTRYYNEGTLIGNGTQWVAKPELTADAYEIANVAPDKRATARIHLNNQGQVDTGTATDGAGFYLYLDGESNPDGAKVYVNGAPLLQHQFYWIKPGSPITQTLEVERGTVDDYNLTLVMYVQDCAKTKTTMNIAVHFLPLSTDVALSTPRQNWVMNTLSPRDSAGYYLPVTIDGFDIHHKNFDHIEFQYKLSTESDDDWVNQCSFYANDSLYSLATGNKAMIENGRITPFRFYGERDPMEQRYDLRAVSFCRYGSGFVTKASPVISGTKDTRPPRVFGTPEPANAILGVGDNLRLRFNEPIAGNYLDEDNNFQILGVTNETGITATTALHFDAADGSVAATKVSREILGGSFTIDMMIRPAGTGERQLFRTWSETAKSGIDISLAADNRIKVQPYAPGFDYAPVFSKSLGEIKEYLRVLVEWNKEKNEFRMYSGTMDVTDTDRHEYQCKWPAPSSSAVLVFGDGYTGDMLEARVWTKALTQEEIGATGDHYLTGYERELAAYYRMNEGRGSAVKDYANGATLYLEGCSWNKHKGFSLHLTKDQRVQLDGNLLQRSAAYDATYMLWFRTTDNSAETANLFSAGRTDAKHGVAVGLESGNIVLFSDSLTWQSKGGYADGEWHHCVMTINRTYNNAAVFVDGNLIQTFPATYATGVEGAMYLGGNFAGNIDELAVFEQALPKTLIEAYDNIALAGDEMGLVGYLPFEEQRLNANGVLEQVFSLNDRRIYRDPLTLKTIEKEVPLVVDIAVEGGLLGTALVADKTQNAPVADHGQLTRMNFDWAFNGDELLINLNMLDREINKQSVYVTVRDVEDMNGNPMASPVTWTAFVDRNSLKWADRNITLYSVYGEYNDGTNKETRTRYMNIVNHSGKRKQYSVESLPEWLSVTPASGSIDPTGVVQVEFTYDIEMPVGVYSNLVYLTDEDGLSEPLVVELIVEAFPPYSGVDKGKYPQTMSLCGQVMLSSGTGAVYDTDPDDIVYAVFRNECVGMANVGFDDISGTSELYLTIYGNAAMASKNISFVLWQASTGKTLNLVPDTVVRFKDGGVVGCGMGKPVVLATGGGEKQNIALQPGWNWVSFNLNLLPNNAPINKIVAATKPWTEGDIIKNPATQHFTTYSDSLDAFVGMFDYFRYIYTYMVYCEEGNNIYVSGSALPADSMHLTVRGGGRWTQLPYLLQETTPVAEALADYYENASAGDMVKSHDRFAVFSQNGRWVGDLIALRPGEGYFLRRMQDGDAVINFYSQPADASMRNNVRMSSSATIKPAFRNPEAATNMTMVAQIEDEVQTDGGTMCVYVGDRLAAVANPQLIDGKPLWFLTVQSDRAGELRFECGGVALVPEMGTVAYAADAHAGSPESPVMLKAGIRTEERTEKRVINGVFYIFRNGRMYDAQGKTVNNINKQ